MDQIRLDIAVHAKTPSLSRSFAHKLIKESKVKVNNEIVTQPSHKIKDTDKILIDYKQEKTPKISLPIIYEDEDCLVINKPTGILSHSKGGFNPEPTVATWLQPLTKGFNDDSGRTGIVHRLDRATSGVMICAKNPAAHEWLQNQFALRKVIKTYFALVEGSMSPDRAMIDIPIERNPKSPQRFRVNHTGKPAQTAYKVINEFTHGGKLFSLLELSPKTGRTHQLRVHLNYLKKPIIGDTFYNGSQADRLYLHAGKLDILLPSNQRQAFEAELPPNFSEPKVNE